MYPGVLRWVLKCKYCPTITLNDIIHRLFTFIVVSKDAISDELTNLFRKRSFPKHQRNEDYPKYLKLSTNIANFSFSSPGLSEQK